MLVLYIILVVMGILWPDDFADTLQGLYCSGKIMFEIQTQHKSDSSKHEAGLIPENGIQDVHKVYSV